MDKQADSPASAPPSPSQSEPDVDPQGTGQSERTKFELAEQKISQVAPSPQQQACKSEDYRKLFHLPPEEVLIQDFNCAFQKKILLQGHMYLFEQYICFYSNIFGYEKKKVLPLKDVAFVRKAWTAGLFPNAIEIVAWGKKYFFASFLSRDEAYRLIIAGWSRHSGHARAFMESPLGAQSGPSSDTQVNLLQSSFTPSTFKSSETPEIQAVSGLTEDGEEKRVLPKSEESMLPDQSDSPMKNDSLWKIEDTNPPPLSSEFKTIMESEFPVDVEDFFELFFSDNAISFVEMFHKRCGDEDFRCTHWTPHPRFGHVRDISFRHPVNVYFGPKSAQCHETQRFRVYRNSHLVIETTQQMSEIPYADYFHVEVRWDVERVPKEFDFHSSVRVSMNVEFSKKTLWKGKIDQATLDECKETYSIWVREAYNILSSKINGADSGRAASSETASESPPRLTSGNDVYGNLEGQDTASKPEGVHLDSDRVENEHVLSRKRSKTQVYVPAVIIRSLRKLWRRVSCFASENPMTIAVLLIAALAIFTQATTLMVLNQRPTTYESFRHPESIRRCLSGLDTGVDALAWLQQRARYVKEEMTLAEARLQSLHQDFSVLKLHMHLFEQMNPQAVSGTQTS